MIQPMSASPWVMGQPVLLTMIFPVRHLLETQWVSDIKSITECRPVDVQARTSLLFLLPSPGKAIGSMLGFLFFPWKCVSSFLQVYLPLTNSETWDEISSALEKQSIFLEMGGPSGCAFQRKTGGGRGVTQLSDPLFYGTDRSLDLICWLYR